MRSCPTVAAWLAAALVAAAILAPAPSRAEPLRLRADALTAAEDPIGVISLEADADVVPWLHAEAVVWVGAGGDGAASGGPGDASEIGGPEHSGLSGDALIVDVEARTLDGRGSARLGRMVATIGALRPLHFDGAAARASLPWRLQLEGFGGSPVVPRTMSRDFDWLVGGRVSRRLGDFGSAGLAYLHQRDGGELATEELAVDAGAALGRRADAATRVAVDLIRFGLAEAQVSASLRHRGWRGELYLSQRNASHLLPATSLFSVLGDLGAQRGGVVVHGKAAPRLDLTAELGGERSGDDLSATAVLRARLALGDRGEAQRSVSSVGSGRRKAPMTAAREPGAIGLELRRTGAALGGWTGCRVSARLPLPRSFTAALELELVRPDHDDKGALWPWSLAALSWRRDLWDVAIAAEASASPELSHRLDVLARLTRRWEGL
jgi:hypothetical protein